MRPNSWDKQTAAGEEGAAEAVGGEAGFFVVALGLAAEGGVAAMPGGATATNPPRMRLMDNKFHNLTKEDIRLRGELFLSPEDGLSLTDYCEIEDLAIVGIDGGRYDGHAFTPDLELILDYSELPAADWPEFRRSCNKGVRIFLAPFVGDQNRRFYMVVFSENDMASRWG